MPYLLIKQGVFFINCQNLTVIKQKSPSEYQHSKGFPVNYHHRAIITYIARNTLFK